jgi:RNA polymerase sigma factor (sigma-70 family)
MTSIDKGIWIREALARYERPLLRYVQTITRDGEAARDVVQETFLKLCKADAAELDGRLAAWLYTVARNHALNVVRKEGRMDPLTEERTATLATPSAGPHEAAAANERQARVVAMLESLPSEQREACRLKFQDGLTYREISQVMGVSLGKVNNLIAAALISMRDQLKAGDLLAGEF